MLGLYFNHVLWLPSCVYWKFGFNVKNVRFTDSLESQWDHLC